MNYTYSIAVVHQKCFYRLKRQSISAFVHLSGSILNMSGRFFIQSVAVLNKKKLFDEELQVTGCTPSASVRGNNSTPFQGACNVISVQPPGNINYRGMLRAMVIYWQKNKCLYRCILLFAFLFCQIGRKVEQTCCQFSVRQKKGKK